MVGETESPAAFIETYTGEMVNVLNPDPDTINIQDIAWSLSRTPRYNGHCDCHYSVAQHSVLLARCAHERGLTSYTAMNALLHDAAEAYLGDIPGPVKSSSVIARCVGPIEAMIEAKIEMALGLPVTKPDNGWLHDADVRICVDERAQVMRRTGNYWSRIDHLEPLGVRIRTWGSPDADYREFLDIFFRILNEYRRNYE